MLALCSCTVLFDSKADGPALVLDGQDYVYDTDAQTLGSSNISEALRGELDSTTGELVLLLRRLELRPGASLRVVGSHAVRIEAQEDILVAATASIDVSSTVDQPGAGANPTVCGGTSDGIDNSGGASGAAGGSFQGAGGDGGSIGLDVVALGPQNHRPGGGCPGGTGGEGAAGGGPGGHGGGSISLEADEIAILGTLLAGGAGGGGAGGDAGGGGGGSGGSISLDCRQLTTTGATIVSANGGGGGGGANQGSMGSAGQDGLPSAEALGGVGTTMGGEGSFGTTLDGAEGMGMNGVGSGGGGGGAGYILIRSDIQIGEGQLSPPSTNLVP